MGDMPDFTARFLPETLREAVMGTNAQQLYKLPAASAQAQPVLEAAHA